MMARATLNVPLKKFRNLGLQNIVYRFDGCICCDIQHILNLLFDVRIHSFLVIL